MPGSEPQTVVIDGRRLKLTNLDKVLYPETGTTKGEVIGYYHEIGAIMVPHLADRPVTRKRWPNGVGHAGAPVNPFFEKNLNPTNTPDWVPRYPIEHSDRTNHYPIVDDLVTLVWLAQLASLEIHVPQWRFDDGGRPQNPDRLVLDLDPGPGVGLPECAEVARWARELMAGIDLELFPVTSGSKGIHLYAHLDGRYTSHDASMIARELAQTLERAHPDLVVSEMAKAQRKGKVFIDWSQNNGNKTTIAPYSLRGRSRPTVAVPRTWDELDEDLEHLDFTEVLARVREVGDLFAPLAPQAVPAPGRPDRLSTYRSMRDPRKTPEPVPAAAPPTSDGQSFVIQEHHARRLHYDFRLEHDGVLVSWAVPKGVPTDPRTNHLAVQTEDHPLEYGSFEGSIPHGEYGGGEVFIFDEGRYELEKWRDGKEVIVTLHGTRPGGVGTGCKVAIIHTGGKGNQPEKNWLMHLMEGSPSVPDPVDVSPGSTDPRRHVAAEATWSPEHGRVPLGPSTGSGRESTGSGREATGTGQKAAGSGDEAEIPFPDEIEPMLATAILPERFGSSEGWAFEMKWDGVRAVCYLAGGRVRLLSRRGNDATVTYPEIVSALEAVDVETAVLDAEVVAMGSDGVPSFSRLQQRMGLTRPADVAAARRHTPVQLVVFDLLHLNGRSLLRDSYDERRAALDALLGDGAGTRIQVPPTFEGDLAGAEAASRQLRLEGVVAKRRTSVYQPGSRAHTWLKIKNFHTQEVVVGGWKPGQGRRDGGVGSLLLGIPGPDGLAYVGKVGTGWTDAMLTEIEARLRPLERKTSPFLEVPRLDAKDARWVTPRFVGEVRYGEFTDDDRLRHPSWRGWRDDKSPEDVRREEP
ncbi:bifunctional non-homologous end joining protein LigD [Friedmanniella endophytica]|uniref:DNA ligase (ATP) n=1 Tax=Microlunatus kandeliicorticis TaxID=1759536 RepID=A0A7W3P6P8_9ACTN|nr:ATP-dependent DNA ligase [Microlunatus kandeliicorticis]MBA8795177.1 bifunctional non-homologous end joining protein LigD [Microlunatus kandeliicorticis]